MVCRAKPQRGFYKREQRRKPGVHRQDIEEEANKSDESDGMWLYHMHVHQLKGKIPPILVSMTVNNEVVPI